MVLAVQVTVQTVVDVQVGIAAEQTWLNSKVSTSISLSFVPSGWQPEENPLHQHIFPI